MKEYGPSFGLGLFIAALLGAIFMFSQQGGPFSQGQRDYQPKPKREHPNGCVTNRHICYR